MSEVRFIIGKHGTRAYNIKKNNNRKNRNYEGLCNTSKRKSLNCIASCTTLRLFQYFSRSPDLVNFAVCWYESLRWSYQGPVYPRLVENSIKGPDSRDGKPHFYPPPAHHRQPCSLINRRPLSGLAPFKKHPYLVVYSTRRHSLSNDQA